MNLWPAAAVFLSSVLLISAGDPSPQDFQTLMSGTMIRKEESWRKPRFLSVKGFNFSESMYPTSLLDWTKSATVMSYLLIPSCVCLLITAALHIIYIRRKWILSRQQDMRASYGVERGFVVIASCAVLLGIQIYIAYLVIYNRSTLQIIWPQFFIFSYTSYVSFAILTVLEAWQALFLLLSRIVYNGNLQVDPDGFYGGYCCFNNKWWKLLMMVIALALLPGAVVAFTFIYPIVSHKLNYPRWINLVFIVPLALCFAANIPILCLRAYALIWRSNDLPTKQKSRERNRTIGHLAVCVTFNTMWIIGLLTGFPQDWPLVAAFYFLNPLLCVLFFIFYCLVREEIRIQVIRCFRTCCRRMRTNRKAEGSVQEREPLLEGREQ